MDCVMFEGGSISWVIILGWWTCQPMLLNHPRLQKASIDLVSQFRFMIFRRPSLLAKVPFLLGIRRNPFAAHPTAEVIHVDKIWWPTGNWQWPSTSSWVLNFNLAHLIGFFLAKNSLSPTTKVYLSRGSPQGLPCIPRGFPKGCHVSLGVSLRVAMFP